MLECGPAAGKRTPRGKATMLLFGNAALLSINQIDAEKATRLSCLASIREGKAAKATTPPWRPPALLKPKAVDTLGLRLAWKKWKTLRLTSLRRFLKTYPSQKRTETTFPALDSSARATRWFSTFLVSFALGGANTKYCQLNGCN